MSSWYLYIIKCKDNSLYTGIATDVKRRFAEHASQGRTCAKYLRGKQPLVLVFKKKIGPSRSDALKFEHAVKKLSKTEKEKIVRTRRIPTQRSQGCL